MDEYYVSGIKNELSANFEIIAENCIFTMPDEIAFAAWAFKRVITVAKMTNCAELAELVEDFAAGPFSAHRQSEIFLATVFVEEGSFVFVNIVAVLQGDFAESPRLDGSLVFLIIPVLCKDVQGIIGLIDATIENYAAVAVLCAGEHLTFDQIVQVGLQGPLLSFCRTQKKFGGGLPV